MNETKVAKYPESTHKRTTFGTGLLKGLGITMRHLLSRSVTIQYPDEKELLPARSRGVIALKEENCTVCMLCARECPDWCIYIEGHKEERAPKQEGKRAKKYNVLDRFAIDYALCMYCGICVDVCPYDALFWSPEYEYAEHDITQLTHEMEKLSDWMYTVLPPDALDEGAMGPELKATAAAPAAAVIASGAPQAPSVGSAVSAPVSAPPSESPGAPPSMAQETSVGLSDEDITETMQGMSDEEAADVGRKVYEEEVAKGTDPRVAEARRKAAVMRARKGTKGPGG